MSGGWRVRRNHARARAQLERDCLKPLQAAAVQAVQAQSRSGGASGLDEALENTERFGAVQTAHMIGANSLLEETKTRHMPSGGMLRLYVIHTDIENRLDCLDCLDCASNGAAFPSPDGADAPGLSGLPAVPWTDDREWCRRLGAAGGIENRRVVLREWVEAAGGWHDAGAVYLSAALPAGMALADLKTHAWMLRFDVREDHDSPEHDRWLRGAPT
jgi:hypothetical protein